MPAILGNDLPKDDTFTGPSSADHRAVDQAWVARHGFMPINHVVAVSEEACRYQSRERCAPPTNCWAGAAAESQASGWIA